MDRAFTNILSADVDAAANFYENLLGMTRHFESDWFIILTHPEFENFELGLLDRTNDVVPDEARERPNGVILTFVVKDVAPIYEKARSMQADVLEPPTDMPYGQCRMLLRDTDGTVLDVSSPTAETN